MTKLWQTLSDEEIRNLTHRSLSPWIVDLIRRVEDLLRYRNDCTQTSDFLTGWQAALNAALEEMQYQPPSKVGEARFTARLVWLKHTPGGYSDGSSADPGLSVPKTLDNRNSTEGE